MNYCAVACPFGGSDAHKIEKHITPLVSVGCCGECHKVHVSLYSVCYDVHVLLTLAMRII